MINIYLIGHDNVPETAALLPDCAVIPFPIGSWDDELTPWPTPSIAKGRAFTGNAEMTLKRLETAIQQYEKEHGIPEKRAIAGYSLAGLFSLWAMTKCSLFDRAASVSGSLWYDGWNEYLKENGFKKQPERVWISVGDREKNTRNPRMKTVEDEAGKTAEWMREQGIGCRFEIMPGGHFDHVDERIGQACRYLSEKLT